MTGPDAAMLAPAAMLARFIAGGGEENLAGFASHDVTILENFAPHLFRGADAVTAWAGAMRAHTRDLGGLVHSFGAAQDFAADGDGVFFTLPTHWSGTVRGRRFEEDGGWSFLLRREAGAWRVRAYAWAVTHIATS
ncbi:MAG TPA: hypothetical protein VNU97_16180 [Rhizomicrobium sp.]|jgi:hypothetical protein|nr:hypothetical protein [Rhizomicrobium sp.]